MEFVRGRYSPDEQIKCPCRKCLNHKEKSLDDVHEDIELNGMSRCYTRWVHHGEGEEDAEQDDDGELADVPEQMSWDGGDQGQSPLDEEGPAEDVMDDGQRGVQGLTQDLRDAASNCLGGNLYKHLMEEAKHELYPGCSEETRLSFLIKLLHIKVYNRISTSGFDAFLELFSSSLKNVPRLPKSYNKLKTVLRKLGFGYVSIDVCKYDCALFWKDHEGDDHCPVCGFTRWKVNKVGRKKVPHKVLRYFPIIPRLQRFFMSKQRAEYARWHKEKRVLVKNEMRHPADGEAWKDFDENFKSFAANPRNLRLAIATDGFNPFGQMSNSYSIWPVIVVPYNFPPWMCMDQSNYMPALLIPGKKSPGKDFHVFMQPLIADLLELWKGVQTYDEVEGKLEKIYPPAFFDVMVHLAVHLPDEALLRGLVQYGWIYPIERRLGTFKRFVRNQARPKGSIAEAYTAYECMTQCSTYFKDIISRFTRPERNLDAEKNGHGYSIFGRGINLLGASKFHRDKDYDSLVWFVLNNCDKVEEYKE
jgi:hypothetical protein